MDAVPPIVIDENGDLGVYPTVAMACLAMEAIDVNNGEYEAFDSEGRRLTPLAHGEVVSLEVRPGSRPDPAELERRLMRYIEPALLADMGIENLDDASLPEMLHSLLRVQQDVRLRSWNWSLGGALRRIARRISGGRS